MNSYEKNRLFSVELRELMRRHGFLIENVRTHLDRDPKVVAHMGITAPPDADDRRPDLVLTFSVRRKAESKHDRTHQSTS